MDRKAICLVRYTDNSPGLTFGILKLVDCKKSKWVDTAIMKIGDIVYCRLNAEFKKFEIIQTVLKYVQKA